MSNGNSDLPENPHLWNVPDVESQTKPDSSDGAAADQSLLEDFKQLIAEVGKRVINDSVDPTIRRSTASLGHTAANLSSRLENHGKELADIVQREIGHLESLQTQFKSAVKAFEERVYARMAAHLDGQSAQRAKFENLVSGKIEDFSSTQAATARDFRSRLRKLLESSDPVALGIALREQVDSLRELSPRIEQTTGEMRATANSIGRGLNSIDQTSARLIDHSSELKHALEQLYERNEQLEQSVAMATSIQQQQFSSVHEKLDWTRDDLTVLRTNTETALTRSSSALTRQQETNKEHLQLVIRIAQGTRTILVVFAIVTCVLLFSLAVSSC